jgi:hypothetical protein
MNLGPGWEDAHRAWRRMRRRAEGDIGPGIDMLADLSTMRRQLDHVELTAVRAARADGRSWAEIATHLGVTRQSAWERWRDLDDPDENIVAAVADELVTTRRRGGGQVEVPSLIGLSTGDAHRMLTDAGFVALLHNAGGKPLPLAGHDGVVTDQVPAHGSRRRVGSAVTVWIERGGEAGVREPRRPRPPLRSATAEQETPAAP